MKTPSNRIRVLFAMLCLLVFTGSFSATSLTFGNGRIVHGTRRIKLSELPRFGADENKTWAVDPGTFDISHCFLGAELWFRTYRFPSTYIYPRNGEVVIFRMSDSQSFLDSSLKNYMNMTYIMCGDPDE